jgi:tetratricopeptide (TPR) repeat protein
LLNRGLAYQQLAEHQKAIDDYTAALRLDAMSAELRAAALYNLALSQQKLQNLSAAIEGYTSALFLDPAFAHAHFGRGNALRESGQFLFALSDYEKAIRYQHPNAAQVYYAEALTYESLKRPNDARKSLELAIAANPQFTQAIEKLASLRASVVAKPVLIANTAVGGGQVTVRKPDLPKAIEPSTELLGEGEGDPIVTLAVSPPTTAKIVDRVPVEEEKIVAVEAVEDEEAAVAAEPEVTETVEEETAEAPVADGWSVQLASATSEDGAWSTWKKMKAKHRSLVAQKPVVVRADLGTKGIVYRVRLAGFEDQNAAKKSCSKLKSSGISCYVSKLGS